MEAFVATLSSLQTNDLLNTKNHCLACLFTITMSYKFVIEGAIIKGGLCDSDSQWSQYEWLRVNFFFSLLHRVVTTLLVAAPWADSVCIHQHVLKAARKEATSHVMWRPCCSTQKRNGSQREDKKVLQFSQLRHWGEFWHISISA